MEYPSATAALACPVRNLRKPLQLIVKLQTVCWCRKLPPKECQDKDLKVWKPFRGQSGHRSGLRNCTRHAIGADEGADVFRITSRTGQRVASHWWSALGSRARDAVRYMSRPFVCRE